MTNEKTYQEFEKKMHFLSNILHVSRLIEWDMQVNMPKGSAQNRAKQCATISELYHREYTDPKVGKLLEALEGDYDQLSEDQQVNVRETRREYDRRAKLTPEFIAEKAMANSQAFEAWVKARAEDNFEAYVPFLEKNLELAKKESQLQGYETNAYDYHLDCFNRGMTEAMVEETFKPLKEKLPALAAEILEQKKSAEPVPKLEGFDIEAQKEFNHMVAEKLNFEFDRGRLDIAPHPFCSGNPLDVRMTTRYHEENPMFSLYATIHETGHALYELGYLKEHHGTPMGECVGLDVHESQSRLWENQVCRSESFWKYWEPEYRRLFPQLKDVSHEELMSAVLEVAPTPIRVDADEVHYNLHVILRFEIERRLFREELQVRDLPQAWKELSEELLNLSPKNDAEGVLQDVHWAYACFGYFPSYSLGNIISAQLWSKAQEALPQLDEQIQKADYKPLLNWLRTNVHHHGKKYTTVELVERVTGSGLDSSHLLQYLEGKYAVKTASAV